jgi:hypothetical protein
MPEHHRAPANRGTTPGKWHHSRADVSCKMIMMIGVSQWVVSYTSAGLSRWLGEKGSLAPLWVEGMC